MKQKQCRLTKLFPSNPPKFLLDVMMTVTTTIVLLTAVAMVTSAPAPDVTAWFKLNGDLDDNDAAAAGAALRWNIIQNVGEYFCTIGNIPACQGVKAYLLVHRLKKEDIKCANVDPVDGVCGEVSQQLDFSGLTDKEIEEALVKIGDENMEKSFEDFKAVDSIRNAMANLVCANENATICDIWK